MRSRASCRRLLVDAAAEELRRPERRELRDDEHRKRLDLRVEIAHGAVVEAPRVLEVVLDLDQLALQREEVVAGLEVGILLLQREDAVDLPRELALDGGLVGERSGSDGARAKLGERRQRRALVRGVALYRGDELRHEIVPARQLDVDVAPGRANLVARRDELVEHDD